MNSLLWLKTSLVLVHLKRCNTFFSIHSKVIPYNTCTYDCSVKINGFIEMLVKVRHLKVSLFWNILYIQQVLHGMQHQNFSFENFSWINSLHKNCDESLTNRRTFGTCKWLVCMPTPVLLLNKVQLYGM